MATDTPRAGHGRLGYTAFPSDPGIGFYRIDGDSVQTLVSETRTWQTLSLTFRVDRDTLDNRLSHLRDTAGKNEIVTNSDGTFRALDRSQSGGVVTITPPGTRTPPRTERDWLVGDYSQRRLEQKDGAYEVSVTFIAREDREPDGNSTGETRSSNEWGFQFRSGMVATPRVRYDFSEGTDTAADTVDLSLTLDAEQTKVLEESASRLAAVSVREVPDGPNSFDDNSGNEHNTVIVTTPHGTDPIPGGKYAVVDWETQYLSNRGYRIDLTLSPTDLTRSGLGFGQLGRTQLGQF